MDWPFLTYTKPQRSRLLELPPEIREYIFEFALTSEKPLVAFKLDEYQEATYQEAAQPSITRVSRQLRNECLPIFYRCNSIILHTDGSKFEDTREWLRRVEQHLPMIQRLSLWVRYVTLTNLRSLASGAICLSIQRSKPDLVWTVKDPWQWITVTRPPSAVASDGRFLARTLEGMISDGSFSNDIADSLSAALVDLRMLYVKEKMS